MTVEQDNISSPDSSWTFEHALLLLDTFTDNKLLTKSLENFLGANESILLSKTLPFARSNAQENNKLEDSFTLRSIQYKAKLTSKQKEYIDEISKLLKMDSSEIQRIVITTLNRVPEDHSLSLNELNNNTSWVQDSINRLESILLYTSIVLKERRIVLNLCTKLLKLDEQSLASSPYISKLVSKMKQNAFTLIESYVLNLSELVEDLKQFDDDQIENLIKTEYSLLIIDVLNMLSTLILKSEKGFTKSTVTLWFKLMSETGYLSLLSSDLITIYQQQSLTIESLSTVISLLFLDLDFNFGSLTDNSSYMNDPEDLFNIDQSILNTSSNPVILYAWSIILHRKFIVISENQNDLQAIAILKKFGDLKTLEQKFMFYVADAAKLEVFTALKQCHQFLKYDYAYTSILGSFIVAFTPYIQLNDDVIITVRDIIGDCSEPIIAKFFSDGSAEELLALARAKMPLSLKSFISLVSINANLAIEELTTLKSYMEIFKEDDFYYKYRLDDQNPDLVRLTQDVDILPPYESNAEVSLLLKEGTMAQIFPSNSANSGQVIAAFLYEYNGWSLLGRILKNLSRQLGNDKEKIELLIEIYKLMNKVLNDCDEVTINNVMLGLNSFIGENDIVDLTFRLLDSALQIRNIDSLVVLTKTLTALAANGYSYRVWSYLYKSPLVGDKTASMATKILGAVEMVTGSYNFTLAILDLGRLLLNDSIKLDPNVSLKLKSEVIDRFVIFSIQVLDGFTRWQYLLEYQRSQLGATAINILQKILYSLYSIDEDGKPEKKVSNVFALASKRITDTFLVPDMQNSRSIKSFTSTIDMFASGFTDYISSDLYGYWQTEWLKSSFKFMTTVINVRSLNQGSVPSTFEVCLYSKAPHMVNIFATRLALRQPVINLLSAMVNADWETEPPSLLTHLGDTHTQILLRSLSTDISNDFEDFALKISLYDFFSAVMEGKQEGLAIVFITGKEIKDYLLSEKNKGVTAKSSSLLKLLKNNISKISLYPNNVTLHLVDAIALAFNSWTTAKEEGDDTQFIKKLVDKLDDFPETPDVQDSVESNYVKYCYEVRLLSKIAEILSLYLFVSQNGKCKDLIIELLKSKKFNDTLLSKFQIVGYRPSLQEDASKAFSKISPNFKLSQFVRSSVFKTNRYGVESGYAFDIMDDLFENLEGWNDVRKAIISASSNKQFASAQINTAQSFGALITCLCQVKGEEINTSSLELASGLLKINDQDGAPGVLFDAVYKGRIELAFLITLSFSKKQNTRVDDKLLFSIITSACRLLLAKEIDLPTALCKADVNYYKPVLRILLITLKMIDGNSMLLVEYGATFADVFTLFVTRSLKILFDSIQGECIAHPKRDFGNSELVSKQIDDISLLINILKTFLSLNLTNEIESSIALSLIKDGSFRSVANIYSCSHLIKVNGEEIYGDFSLSVLYELVKNKVIAEKLLMNGVYGCLLDSAISVKIQKGGIVPLSPTKSKLHHLWVGGILPIALTLLGQFGERVLPESCLFASAFERQLAFTTNSWLQSNTAISTPTIEETVQIVMLAKTLSILGAYDYIRERNGLDSDKKVVLIPGMDTKEERLNFVNSLNYLISHPKYLTSRVFPSDLEQQKILESHEKSKFIESLLDEIKLLKDSLLE